ncbi:YncE family protein [Flavobacterium sp.]|jgi:hypothetical protein|uniref:YncE family protein n=1 Tax=Flavobacterium sp. TaxID=239 RepID=UPI0037C097F4
MKCNKLFLLVLFSSLFFVSCVKEDTPPFYTSKGTYDSGVLVLNEGNFQTPTASISYISFDLNKYTNNIYGLANGSSLGDSAQSIGFYNDLAYIVVSNSDKIEVVNRYTMVKLATISSDLNNPRYITFANGKAYVTNQANFESFDDDYISVINLATNSQIKTISVPGGSAEKIIADGNKLYLAQGGLYTSGNKIVVLDANTDTILNSITVGDSPNSMEIENGSLWVLCGGNSRYFPTAPSQTSGKLIKINLSNNSVQALISFPYDTGGDNPLVVYPSNLVLYGANKYFTIGSKIYKLKTIVSENGSISYSYPLVMTTSADELLGFAIKTNKIYVSDVKDYTQNGKVLVYSLGETQDSPSLGSLLKTIDIGGIAPNGFYFNQ